MAIFDTRAFDIQGSAVPSPEAGRARLRAPRPGLAVAAFASLLAWALASCATGSVPSDPIERAKLATKLERDAETKFGDYVRSTSNPEGVDRDALRAYVDLRKQITQLLGPADSPRAYADYAAALRRLGLDHEAMAAALAQEREGTSDPAEQARLEERVKAEVAASRDCFRRSNGQFETYFRASEALGTLVHPDSYKWALLNADALEDWRMSLRSLEAYISSVTLTPEGKVDADERRRFYQERIRIQEEQQLERDLGLPTTASTR